MPTFAAGVATYTVLLTLLAAVAGRARHPDVLVAALTTHRVLPGSAVTAVAAAVTTIEAVLAGALLVGLFGAAPTVLAAALTGCAVLFAAYAGYAWYLVGTGRGGPCGCGPAEVPVSGWVVARAAALAGLACGALLAPGAVPTDPGAPLVIVLLAAGTFGALLWQLPAAMVEAVS